MRWLSTVLAIFLVSIPSQVHSAKPSARSIEKSSEKNSENLSEKLSEKHIEKDFDKSDDDDDDDDAPPIRPGGAPPIQMLSMDGNVLAVDGHPLRFMDPLQRWIRVLGPPTRQRVNGGGTICDWDALGLEAATLGTPDGRRYVAFLRLMLVDTSALPLAQRSARMERRLPARGFPGKIRYQGVILEPRPPSLHAIQEALPAGSKFSVNGKPLHAANATFTRPDGFNVGVHVELLCNPGSIVSEHCDETFQEMEISVPGGMTWE